MIKRLATTAVVILAIGPSAYAGDGHHHGNSNWLVAPLVGAAILGTALGVAAAPFYAPPAYPYGTGYPMTPQPGYVPYTPPYARYNSVPSYQPSYGYGSGYGTGYGTGYGGYPTTLHSTQRALCPNSYGWAATC